MSDMPDARGARASKRRNTSAKELNPLRLIPPLGCPFGPHLPPKSFRMDFSRPPLNLHLKPNLALTSIEGK